MALGHSVGFCVSNNKQEFSLFCPDGKVLEISRVFMGVHNRKEDTNCFQSPDDCVEDIDKERLANLRANCSSIRPCSYNYADSLMDVACAKGTHRPDYFQINYTCAGDDAIVFYATVGALAFLLLLAVMVMFILYSRHGSCRSCFKCEPANDEVDATIKQPKGRSKGYTQPKDEHTYVNEVVLQSPVDPVQRWSSLSEYDKKISSEQTPKHVSISAQRPLPKEPSKAKSRSDVSAKTRSLPQLPVTDNAGYDKLIRPEDSADDHEYVVPAIKDIIIETQDSYLDPAPGPAHDVDSKNKKNQAAKQSRPKSEMPASAQKKGRENPEKAVPPPKEYDSDTLKRIKGNRNIKDVINHINENQTNTMM